MDFPYDFDPDHPSASLNANERAFYAHCIARCGLAICGGCAGIRADRLIVSYTCGLTERGLPELVISPFRGEIAAYLLNQMSTLLPPAIGPNDDMILIENFAANEMPAMLRRLPTREANEFIVHKTRLYYGRDVEVMQVVVPDKNRRWPWEEGVDPAFAPSQYVLRDWTDRSNEIRRTHS